jgi:hypothetical protein
MWLYFKHQKMTSVEKNIPTKNVGKKSHLSWVTRTIKTLINKKNKLHKKQKKNKKYSKQCKNTKKIL